MEGHCSSKLAKQFMLSNVSDDLAEWEVDHLLTFFRLWKKNSSLDHSQVNDYSQKSYKRWLQPKELQEHLDSRPQMMDFTNTKKKL